MHYKSFRLLFLATLLLAGSCRENDEFPGGGKPPKLMVREFAAGLSAPLGLAIDPKGQIWVTEAGTGKQNDGSVSVITPNGKVNRVITGFTSVISPEGVAAGLNHLLYKDGLLYILHGVDGNLYIADVSSFKPGDKPLQLSDLPAENLSKFVVDHAFEVDTDFSNIYNLTFGPDGALYIADAGANAIIRRSQTGQLSVFAAIPGIQNPTPEGPSTIDGVPTGIVYDGEKFLVSTLTGFPFPAGQARIYQVDPAGKVSLYQEGFTTLVDIALGADNRPLVLQIATFGPQGLAPNTGTITRSTPEQNMVLLEGLNLPADLERRGPKTWYVTSLADGKVLKVD